MDAPYKPLHSNPQLPVICAMWEATPPTQHRHSRSGDISGSGIRNVYRTLISINQYSQTQLLCTDVNIDDNYNNRYLDIYHTADTTDN